MKVALPSSYKSDWAEARERLTAWWDGEATDRVVAMVRAPRRGTSPPDLDASLPNCYTDAATVFSNLDRVLASTFYGGEALPMHWVNLGPVPLGGYLGCPLKFMPDTVWQDRLYGDWESIPRPLPFDPNHAHYRKLLELTSLSLARAEHRYLVSGQGFGCASDVLASLVGLEPLLYGMLERPWQVHELLDELTSLSLHLFDELDAMTSAGQEGTFDWIQLWSPGRIWSLQSDLCCMLSPEAFDEYVLPELRREANHVDCAFYHLDGPGAIKHLDSLLGIETLCGIQWVPGAGVSGDPLDWLDLFHRVQAAGKKLLIYSPPERVTPLLNRISRHGVCLDVSCRDQSTAEQTLLQLDQIGL